MKDCRASIVAIRTLRRLKDDIDQLPDPIRKMLDPTKAHYEIEIARITGEIDAALRKKTLKLEDVLLAMERAVDSAAWAKGATV